ncbi:hypothetical protein ACMXYX_18000 (plasmid) [Neptuniibacter sp. QD72_48]|uniref:hypothetical protein n=1 Tax=Neptuniibacter sp. QD72_48 TaxID=3398214 RepID=UPI0039F5D379
MTKATTLIEQLESWEVSCGMCGKIGVKPFLLAIEGTSNHQSVIRYIEENVAIGIEFQLILDGRIYTLSRVKTEVKPVVQEMVAPEGVEEPSVDVKEDAEGDRKLSPYATFAVYIFSIMAIAVVISEFSSTFAVMWPALIVLGGICYWVHKRQQPKMKAIFAEMEAQHQQ